MTASLSWRFDFRLAPSFYFFLLTRALWLASRDLSARAVDDDLISLPKPQPTTLKPSRTNTHNKSSEQKSRGARLDCCVAGRPILCVAAREIFIELFGAGMAHSLLHKSLVISFWLRAFGYYMPSQVDYI
jgi:hypothetical protein